MKNFRDIVLVSPDAGANKKTFEVAKYFSTNFIRADKLRDLTTGQIKETIVYADDLTGKTAVILDDICDGGRTFIELAKVLKAKGAAKVILFVTHGIFSAGLDPLFAGGIDAIWTTDSFPLKDANEAIAREVCTTPDNFHVIPLKEYTRFKN
jgi:ribose-phosphate pyrophosphokinase